MFVEVRLNFLNFLVFLEKPTLQTWYFFLLWYKMTLQLYDLVLLLSYCRVHFAFVRLWKPIYLLLCNTTIYLSVTSTSYIYLYLPMRAWIGATQFSTKESNDTTKGFSNKKAAWYGWRVFKQKKKLDFVEGFSNKKNNLIWLAILSFMVSSQESLTIKTITFIYTCKYHII